MTKARDLAGFASSSVTTTASDGLVLKGDGSTTDVIIKNGANATVATVTDGSTNLSKVLARGSIDVGNASGVSAPLAKGAAGTVLTSDGTDLSFQTPAGGASDFVHISTQTVSSATAQVEFNLSSTDYGSFYVYAYDCTFSAAPSNEYCLYFTFYDGAYDSGNPSTNRMSVRYQQGFEYSSTISTSSSWAYNLTMRSGQTPSTSTKFGFSGLVGGRTNSPLDLNGYFGQGSTFAAGPRIRGICPNTSDNMTYMLVAPSTTTFATGKFALYGLKDA